MIDLGGHLKSRGGSTTEQLSDPGHPHSARRPKRVLQVFASLDRGGAEQVVLEWYKQIDRRQVQFDFVAYERSEPYALEEVLTSLGARIYKVPYPWGRGFWKSVRAWRELLRDHPEWRVIHAHYTATSPLIFALGRLQDRRCIAHGHASNRSLQWPLHLLGFLLSSRNLACSSESQRRLFHPMKADSFPNAVSVKAFAFDPEGRAAVRDEVGERGLLLGHVGRFSAEKNHLFLLEIFAEISKLRPDARLVLVGQGALETEAKQRAASLGIAGKVHFLGVRDDVPSIMSALDLLIMPSLFEGMPITMLEAQTSGLPCLVSDVVSEDSRIPGVGDVQMMPLSASPSAWARRALEMLDEEPRDRAAAAEKVKGSPYDIETSAQRLLEVYGV